MITSFIIFLSLSSAASALPTIDSVSPPHQPHKRCGPVSDFFGQTPLKWQTVNTDKWLEQWSKNHSSEISSNSGGFAGAFGQWAIGNPDWSCRDDGSASSCDLDLCDNRVLNSRGGDIQNAYYVLEGVNRLHSYFIGLSQAFEVSAIAASLSKESWSQTFYKPKNNDKALSTLREVLNAVTTVISIGASFAGLGAGAAITGAIGGAMSAVAGGAAAAGSIQLQSA